MRHGRNGTWRCCRLELERDDAPVLYTTRSGEMLFGSVTDFVLERGPLFSARRSQPMSRVSIDRQPKFARRDFIVNTPLGKKSQYDERAIRTAAVAHSVPCVTTLAGAMAVLSGIEARRRARPSVRTLQESLGSQKQEMESV